MSEASGLELAQSRSSVRNGALVHFSLMSFPGLNVCPLIGVGSWGGSICLPLVQSLDIQVKMKGVFSSSGQGHYIRVGAKVSDTQQLMAQMWPMGRR